MPGLLVREGLWRGAQLALNDSNDKVWLTGIYYGVPTIAATVLLVVICGASLSLILTIIASAVAGAFTPAAAFGGILGVMIAEKVAKAISRNTMNSPWASHLKDSIERANS